MVSELILRSFLPAVLVLACFDLSIFSIYARQARQLQGVVEKVVVRLQRFGILICPSNVTHQLYPYLIQLNAIWMNHSLAAACSNNGKTQKVNIIWLYIYVRQYFASKEITKWVSFNASTDRYIYTYITFWNGHLMGTSHIDLGPLVLLIPFEDFGIIAKHMLD